MTAFVTEKALDPRRNSPSLPAAAAPHVAAFEAERRTWLGSIDGRIATATADNAPTIEEGSLGIALGKRNAAIYDRLLGGLFSSLCGERPGVLVAAVGSYGRGAVALKSDLDVRIIARRIEDAAAASDALLYPLWDMGISVGHQAVTPEDLVDGARTDLPTATALLDLRPIAGDQALFEAIGRRVREGTFAHSEIPRFIERLSAEVAQRHDRFGGSVYLLEPDVKNGAGGLRDLDVATWALKARFGVGEPRELVRRVGVLVTREAEQIEAAAELLWRARNVLHMRAGRRADRLAFEQQEVLAALFGYGSGGEAVEHMMSDYYRSARTISRALDMILSLATPVLTKKKPREEDLGNGVAIFGDHITTTDTRLLKTDPALALRLVDAAVERGLALWPHTRDAIAGAGTEAAWCESLRASPESGRLFLKLITTSKDTKLRAGSAMRELYDLGLLLAMVPEFLPVVGRTHHDMYHVYTVDVHSVAAVEKLASLVRGEAAADLPLAARLAMEIARPEMLFAATLLHDVGKAIGRSDHSTRGAELAEIILARLGMAPLDAAQACHLIRKHLVMYHVATRRDVDDPTTIEEFAREVTGSRETLRDLYLLTMADLSTTSPTSLTAWKTRMLDELYLATDAALGGERTRDGRVAEAITEALAAIEQAPSPSEEERKARGSFAASYLASMGERYLLSNAPRAIASHVEVVRRHASRLVSVEVVPSRHAGAAEICVVAPDQPGLLANIAAALAVSRLEVHAAQIYSRKLPDGATQAVDIFWVRDRGDGTAGVARSLPKLEADLEALLGGQRDAALLAQRRFDIGLRRPGPKVKKQVIVDDRASPTHTVIEVFAEDRPGLLFAIAHTLYEMGLSIAIAKINTEGTKVADVFYVVDRDDGRKIAPGARTTDVTRRLVSVLEGLDGGQTT